MDVFDELLRGVRGKGAVFGRSVLWPPWSLRFADAAYLTRCVPPRGAGWIVPEAGEARYVTVGEAAMPSCPSSVKAAAATAAMSSASTNAAVPPPVGRAGSPALTPSRTRPR